MKTFIFSMLLVIGCNTMQAQGGNWVYWKGAYDTTMTDTGHYGTKGVANAANVPPGRYQCAYWQDLKGNFWIFGGTSIGGVINDLWMFDPKTKMWTWINGPQRNTNTAGSYGTLGVPSSTNCPPARGYGANCVTDNKGDLWLYSGYGGTDDLWKYNIASNEWTWMAGHKTAFSANHGNKGVAAATNTPGTRDEMKAGWVDSSNNLWMFGGRGTYNDMWKFSTDSNLWTWVKGDTTVTSPGIYGTMGVEKSTNLPSARCSYSKWKDDKGNFYIFGGGLAGFKNDVWRYNPHTNNWTWIAGDSVAGDSGQYNKQCQLGLGNMPCARYENETPQTMCCNAVFWTFGGFSGCTAHTGVYNDLWAYDIRTNEWSWVSGKPESDSGHYGAPGKVLSTNAIGSRGGVGIWTDSLNHLWIFGGYNYKFSAKLNDIWEFIPDASCILSSLSVDNIPVPGTTPYAHVYPNPANNSLYFDNPNDNEKVIISFNTLDGKLIKQLKTAGGRTEIPTAELAEGVYIVTMRSALTTKSWKINIIHN